MDLAPMGLQSLNHLLGPVLSQDPAHIIQEVGEKVTASGDLTTVVFLLFLMIAIYMIIIFVFYYARRKYKGGLIETVINLIICTVGFLLVSDLSLFLSNTYGLGLAFTTHVVFKILAMVFLSIGGLKFFVK